MSLSSKIQILLSNSYSFTVKQIVNLYLGEVVRKFWYVVLPFAALLGTVIFKNINDPFPSNLITPVVSIGVFLFARHRFISGIRKSVATEKTTVMAVFHDRLEFADNDHKLRVYQLADIHGFSLRRVGYVIRLNNNTSMLVPVTCFKSEVDRERFESVLMGR